MLNVLEMSLNLKKNVLEFWRKCPGKSWNVLEFDFENIVVTMNKLKEIPKIHTVLYFYLVFVVRRSKMSFFLGGYVFQDIMISRAGNFWKLSCVYYSKDSIHNLIGYIISNSIFYLISKIDHLSIVNMTMYLLNDINF